VTIEGFAGYQRGGSDTRATRLDLNEAPREIGQEFRRRLLDELDRRAWRRYPDIDAGQTRELAAGLYGWSKEGTLVGNGSNELLSACVRVLLPAGGRMVTLSPSFSMYPVLARRARATLDGVALRPPDFAVGRDELLQRVAECDLAVLASPNNPTGAALPLDLLESALAAGKPLIWDAAYVDFTDADPVSLLSRHDNLIVLRSLSKAWALAGLRAGALLASPPLVRKVSNELLPFDTGWVVECAFATARALAGESTALIRETVAERERLRTAINGLRGFEAAPSAGNFFLLRRSGLDGGALRSALAERGLAVRDVAELTADGYVRVTVGSPAEGDRLLAALNEVADV